MSSRPRFHVNKPDPERAETLANQALEAAKQAAMLPAIRAIEAAIRLDQIMALNAYHSLRAQLYEAAGNQMPGKALDLYNYAASLKREGRYGDARITYEEAMATDPFFLWPANNLAWMLSTNSNRTVRNGKDAVTIAFQVCEQSNWNCWAFIGTLAASYAEFGDFERAIGWQLAELTLVPADHRRDSEIVLRHFQAGKPYVDEGMPVAAGMPTEQEAWFFTKNGKDRLGPFSSEQLHQLISSGLVLPTDMVLKHGNQRWMPVRSVDELISLPASREEVASLDGKTQFMASACCSVRSLPFSILFRKHSSKIWLAERTFKRSAGTSEKRYPDQTYHAEFFLSDSYTGCPFCCDQGIFRCPNCDELGCMGTADNRNPSETVVTCGVCKNSGPLGGALETIRGATEA